MKLVDMKICEYLDVLKSNAPAPGGGSVSALAGAQGVALFMMVTDLTIGRERYADFQQVCIDAKAKGEALYADLVVAIDKDTDAYNLVAEAFKLPKDSDEEKAARTAAIRSATLEATKVPFSVMELGLDALLVTKELVGMSNPNASSDLGVCALNLVSAIKGAWLNVKINLPGIKNPEIEADFASKGAKILAECEVIADEIYSGVVESL